MFMNKYLKLIACNIGVLLLLASCIGLIPLSPDINYFSFLCENNSADTILVSFFGHEIGKEEDGVMPLLHSQNKIAPNKTEYRDVGLNWGLGEEWDGIWYSYGIDTLYVVISKSDIKNKCIEGFYPWNDDDTLRVMKYTKGDYPLDTKIITITYP